MYKRVIIKVGTKVLSAEDGSLDGGVLKHLVQQISEIKKKGVEVVLITSGAMGAGRSLITLKHAEKVAEKQVLAAVGQVKLMSMYSELFGQQGEICAQVLATKEDFRDKAHYFNMRTCFENLLKNGVVPVVNENDVVATTELLFTDNDELAGLVASQLNADAVVILTSVEGFLTGDPKDPSSELIPEIDFNNIHALEQYISPDKTAFGRGGMLTKFHIAKKLTLHGVTVFFANGKRKDALLDILSGKKIGTKFISRGKVSPIKRRVAYSDGLTKGAIHINACAVDILMSKEKIISVLPIGIINVEGDFSKGDIIEIIGDTGQKMGFGITKYNAEKVKELMGTKNGRAVIHYDHMFIQA